MTTWGKTVEHAVQEKTKAAKTRQAAEQGGHQVMMRYLNADRPQAAPGRFRDPMAG